MMLRQIHQTIFQVEQMKSIVGVGGTAAYQIEVTRGRALGTVGAVSIPAHAVICNDPTFDLGSTGTSSAARILTRFKRALATLKF